MKQIHSTTILCVRRNGHVALGGDGQVTIGDTVMKANANKVRALKGGKILAGFAGAAADAFTLFEKFEEKLERYPGNLPRAAVELAKDWRSDRVLRRLEALLVVADKEHGYVISGSGAVAVLGPPGEGYRQAIARDRRRDLRVHERAHYDTGALDGRADSHAPVILSSRAPPSPPPLLRRRGPPRAHAP